MAIRRPNLKFYFALHMLMAAFALFLLAKEDLPNLPPRALLGAAGGTFAAVYLVLVSAWAIQRCREHQYAGWLAPLSGGLAGLVLGVGIEFIFFQNSPQEGSGVNGCLVAGAIVSAALFSKSFLQARWDSRGSSGRMRTWV